MKHIIPIAALAALAAIAWHVGGMIPPAALTLALGVLFGLMVGIPIAGALRASEWRPCHNTQTRIARTQTDPCGFLHTTVTSWLLTVQRCPQWHRKKSR